MCNFTFLRYEFVHAPISISSRSLRLIICFLTISFSSFAQDISIFTQRVSQGFLLNPAVAGSSGAQALLSYRNNYTGVRNAPNNNYLSLSSPIGDGRFGVGLNLIQDNSALLKSTFLNAAFAYHLVLSPTSALSAGISADMNSLRLGEDLLLLNNGNDVILNQYKGGLIVPDFSTGLMLRTQYLRVSAAVNHLSTSWNEKGAVNLFTRYVSGSVLGAIPMSDGRSYIEPYINYRSYFNVDQIIDIGTFYNYDEILLVGLGVRNLKLASLSVGLTVRNGLFVGYSREQLFGNIGLYLGSTNEVVVKLQMPGRGIFVGPGSYKLQGMDDRRLMYKTNKKSLQKYYIRKNKSKVR